MRAYWALPESLQIAAYSADGEYAWPREQAIVVVQCLTERDCAVVGVDVWLATEVGPTIPTPVIYGWEGDSRRPPESWTQYVQRVNARAGDYIAAFAWHPQDGKHRLDVPYFNLT